MPLLRMMYLTLSNPMVLAPDRICTVTGNFSLPILAWISPNISEAFHPYLSLKLGFQVKLSHNASPITMNKKDASATNTQHIR